MSRGHGTAQGNKNVVVIEIFSQLNFFVRKG